MKPICVGDWLAVLFWRVDPKHYHLGIWHDGELVREPVMVTEQGVDHFAVNVLRSAVSAEASFTCDQTASFEQARGIIVRELERHRLELAEYKRKAGLPS